MEFSFKVINEKLVIYLRDRIDSNNAKEVQDSILLIVNNNPHSSLELDANNLEFISSAGLRVILFFAKLEKSLQIVNVSSSVYEVFEMTGFTSMIDILKKFRTISIDGCEVIGQGANGTVYKISDDTIVKVYKYEDALPDIENERKLARKAFMLGVPTAIPYDIVKVNDKYGSVFELLNAKMLTSIFMDEDSDFDKYIDMSAKVLKSIHEITLPPNELPLIKSKVMKRVKYLEGRIPNEVYNKVYKMVEEIPEDNTVLHGDYHIKNIMLQNDELLLIDMDTFSQGNIIFEFANMYTGYIGFGETDPDNIEKFLGIPITTAAVIFYETLYKYFGTRNRAFIDSIWKKCALLSAIRLYKRMDTQEDPTLHAQAEHFKQRIIYLAKHVDELYIKGE